MINKDRLIRITQQLIRIKSENPPGDERQIAAFVNSYLKRLGFKTRVFALKRARPNVIGLLSGRNREHTLLLTPHLDTVPQGRHWHFPPFGGMVHKGRLYGLGATDCKGNIAAGLEAINSLIEDGRSLDYNLLFAATADEESGSVLGLLPLLERKILRPDAALVLDSDDFNIIVAQKGLLHIKVKIKGKKAHGAYPWLGINAIDIAVAILRDLKSYRFIHRKNKYLKPPTLNIGTISGGDKVNVVADWCEFELDFRFLPGDSGEGIIGKLKKIIRKHTVNFKIEVQGLQQYFSIEEKHPLVACLSRAMRKMKVRPKVCGSEGATVISFFQNEKIPAIATGFGCSGCAHSSDEYVKINSLYKGAMVLEEFLKDYQLIKRRK